MRVFCDMCDSMQFTRISSSGVNFVRKKVLRECFPSGTFTIFEKIETNGRLIRTHKHFISYDSWRGTNVEETSIYRFVSSKCSPN